MTCWQIWREVRKRKLMSGRKWNDSSPFKRKKNQIYSNFNSITLAPQNNFTNSTLNRDVSLGSMVMKDTQLSKTSSSICKLSLEGREAEFMNNSVSNPQPRS
jgi:hypothetical protein